MESKKAKYSMEFRKQFEVYSKKASATKGVTGEVLYMCEARLIT
jgi:hypothetical protein